MTSTSFNVGLGDATRNSSKVLKPPGGGSSDIFGTTEQQQSPRKVKQYMASNVILSDDVPPSSGPGSTASSTSSSGSAPDTPSSPTRNGTTSTPAEPAEPVASGPVAAAGAVGGEPKGRSYQMQSHFVLGYDKNPSPVKGAGSVGTPEEGDVKDGAVREGNPVTGEGYAQQNGQGKSNGSPAPSAPRSRVPPGGYSSGLW